MNVIAIIGELDRLAAGAAAALAFGGAFGAPRGQQLELLEAAQQFGSEQRLAMGGDSLQARSRMTGARPSARRVRIWAMMWSVVMPSASASKLRISR